VDLRWTLSSGTVSGYNVYRKLSTDASYTLLTQLAASPVFPVRDTSASGSSTYSYGVTAFNQGGSSAMATALVNTPACVTSNGGLRWAEGMGGAGADQGNAVAVRASNGNVVVAGNFMGSASFGGVTLTSAGFTDFFVAEYTPTGSLVWAKRYGGANGDERVSAVALDPSGNIAVVGSFWGTADFGGGSLVSDSNSDDIFLVKLSATGTHLWSQRFGSYRSDGGIGVTADSNGDVILTGAFAGTVDFGGGPLTSTALGNTDTIVAKYASATGTFLWAHNFPSGGDDAGASVAVDGTNNVLVTGYFVATINYGGGTLTSAGQQDIGVVKLSPAGAHLWSARFGGTGSDNGTAIAADSSGDVLVTGTFENTMKVGSTTLTGTDIVGQTSVFLTKLAGSSGSPLWARGSTGGQGDNVIARSLDIDNAKNVVVTGDFLQSTNLGGGILTSAGMQDVFVAKYTTSGSPLWSERFGGVEDEYGRGIAVYPSNGNITLIGRFRDSTNILGTPLTGAGSTDTLLVGLAP
jgi:hypothetical protein